jgi:hypothetical protein
VADTGDARSGVAAFCPGLRTRIKDPPRRHEDHEEEQVSQDKQERLNHGEHGEKRGRERIAGSSFIVAFVKELPWSLDIDRTFSRIRRIALLRVLRGSIFAVLRVLRGFAVNLLPGTATRHR